MNDFPHRVLGRLLVRRNGDLAGAAAMSGLADEAESLRLTNRHDVLLDDLVDIWTLFARIVAAVGKQWVGVRVTVRNGRFHDDVSVGDASHHGDQRRKLIA